MPRSASRRASSGCVTRRSALHAPAAAAAPRADAGGVAARPARAARRPKPPTDDDEIEEDEDDRGRAAPRAQARAREAGQALERRLSAARADAARRAEAHRPLRAEPGIDPGERHVARKRAGRFRRARRDHQCAPRPGGHALRARAGARHQVVARDRPGRRHRPLDERALRARRRGVRAATPSASSCRTPKREKVYLRELLVGRRLQRHAGEAAALPRQDHRRRAGDRRSRAHAASADRRHHRLGQVGRHQHHDPELLYRLHAGAMPADHGRSEDARALRL